MLALQHKSKVNVMTNVEKTVGWTWHIGDEDKLSAVVQQHYGLGNTWKVVAYGSQVVIGINYIFVTEKSLVGHSDFEVVLVHAHQAPGGEWGNWSP
jgi:hypothetical protein